MIDTDQNRNRNNRVSLFYRNVVCVYVLVGQAPNQIKSAQDKSRWATSIQILQTTNLKLQWIDHTHRAFNSYLIFRLFSLFWFWLLVEHCESIVSPCAGKIVLYSVFFLERGHSAQQLAHSANLFAGKFCNWIDGTQPNRSAVVWLRFTRKIGQCAMSSVRESVCARVQSQQPSDKRGEPEMFGTEASSARKSCTVCFNVALCTFLREIYAIYNFLEFFEQCSHIYNHNDG